MNDLPVVAATVGLLGIIGCAVGVGLLIEQVFNKISGEKIETGCVAGGTAFLIIGVIMTATGSMSI